MSKQLHFIFIIFLLFFCICLSFSQNKKEVKQVVALNPDGKVVIDTYKGEVIVDTWDKPEVEIYAVIKPDGNIFSDNDEWLIKNTEIEIYGSGSYLKIKSDYSKINDGRKEHSFLGLFNIGESYSLPLVKYNIKMPKTAKLSIKDYKSSIETSNISDIDLDTYKGEVRIYKLNGRLELKTYKGNAEIEFNNVKDYCYVDTYKGKIDIKIPDDNKFDLKLALEKKTDFYSNFNIDERSKKKGYFFRTSINGGGPEIEIKSHKGDIQVRKI